MTKIKKELDLLAIIRKLNTLDILKKTLLPDHQRKLGHKLSVRMINDSSESSDCESNVEHSESDDLTYLDKITQEMSTVRNSRLINICIKKHFLKQGETENQLEPFKEKPQGLKRFTGRVEPETNRHVLEDDDDQIDENPSFSINDNSSNRINKDDSRGDDLELQDYDAGRTQTHDAPEIVNVIPRTGISGLGSKPETSRIDYD